MAPVSFWFADAPRIAGFIHFSHKTFEPSWLSAMDIEEAVDINGEPVHVGSRVRVLKISDEILSQLPEADATAARAMEGDILEVYEIDEWGSAWVEKSWHEADGTPVSHALGLGPEQMEVLIDPDVD